METHQLNKRGNQWNIRNTDLIQKNLSNILFKSICINTYSCYICANFDLKDNVLVNDSEGDWDVKFLYAIQIYKKKLFQKAFHQMR